MPGLLTGLNDQNQLQALQSFGMALVELKDASGNPLQIAPGKTVTLKLPAPADGPATIPLWHFNETYGIWVKAGVATKTGDSYTAELTHFSTWNLDLEFKSFRLDLQFQDQQGNTLTGLHAEAYTDGANKIESFYTDNEGKATLINCPSSKPIIIKISFQCDTLMKTLDPVTENRSEAITVFYGSGLKTYTVAGTLSGCDNTPFANQPFKITIQGDGSSIGLPAVPDAQGNYNVTGLICKNSNALSVQAMAFIGNEYKYAPAATITATNSIYNAQICDSSVSIPDNFQILFPDPTLDSLIRANINKPIGAIYYSDVKTIDTLVTFAAIGDLSGIQFCSSLKVLDLRGGVNFSDLSLLQNLVSLQGLFISEVGNGLISDISPLQNLTQLQDLSLTCPILSDISPLQNLRHLRSLSLKGGNISDISPLRNLTSINWLSLNSDALNDVTPLQNLTQLKNLGIDSKGLTRSSLNVLQNFTSLINLTVGGTSISDFSIVKTLPQLQYLHLDRNQISDISQFTSLTNLISLELSQNRIADISALQTMTQLQYLKLSYNQIADISSLKNLSAAIIIDLDQNLITDVTSLQNLNSLQILWLGSNQISNINPLIAGVPNLQVLRILYQQQGKIIQTQQDAFKSSHPACYVEW